jgi:hypothetical protein
VVPRCAAPGSFRAPARPLPACGRRLGVLPARARPVAAPPRHTLRAAGRRSPARRRCCSALPLPLSLLTARLRRGGAAFLLKDKLGDLRGAVERLREVVAAARVNPTIGWHEKTTKYAAALAEWEALAAKLEARELRFNPQSPWACATNKGRAIYWRNGPWQTTLEAPAEGVQNLTEEADESFNKRWSELQ